MVVTARSNVMSLQPTVGASPDGVRRFLELSFDSFNQTVLKVRLLGKDAMCFDSNSLSFNFEDAMCPEYQSS